MSSQHRLGAGTNQTYITTVLKGEEPFFYTNVVLNEHQISKHSFAAHVLLCCSSCLIPLLLALVVV
jgi:hypothetical protein